MSAPPKSVTVRKSGRRGICGGYSSRSPVPIRCASSAVRDTLRVPLCRQEPMIRRVTPCMSERSGFHTTTTLELWKGQEKSRRIESQVGRNCQSSLSPSLLTTQPRESGFSKSQRLLKKPLSLGATKDLTGAAGWYQGRLQPASWIRAYRVSCDAQREGFILPGLRP